MVGEKGPALFDHAGFFVDFGNDFTVDDGFLSEGFILCGEALLQGQVFLGFDHDDVLAIIDGFDGFSDQIGVSLDVVLELSDFFVQLGNVLNVGCLGLGFVALLEVQ